MEKQTNSCMPGKGWKWLLIDDIGRPLIMLRGVYWSSSLERDDDVCPSTVFAWMGLTGGVCVLCVGERERKLEFEEVRMRFGCHGLYFEPYAWSGGIDRGKRGRVLKVERRT